ncbi:MAG: hypothetical protein ACM32E_16490 [Gemmatimonadota bacterium]
MATVTRLTPRQRRSLTGDGYLLVPSLLGGADLARIAARLTEHVRQTVAAWAEQPSLDTHEGPAGSLILFNGADLWHSGTLNYSPAPRLALTAGFGHGPHRQPSG